MNVYPAEIWYYYAPPNSNLPPYFALVFYKKYGGGEYKLYDPFADGPDKLFLQREQYDVYNYEMLYEKLKELDANLAEVSLSLIPGEIPMNYMPSPRTPYIIASILDLPKKDVNVDYAKNFHKFKGMVEEEYSVNYIPNNSLFRIVKNSLLNMYFINYAIKIKSLSIDEYKDKYYTNFELNGVIKDKTGKIVFQYKKSYPISFDDKRLESFKQSGIVFVDMVPIIRKDLYLQVLIKNTLSKEFTLAEYAINFNGNDKVFLSEPIIGYEYKDLNSNEMMPFMFNDRVLNIDPDRVFLDTDILYITSSISELKTGEMYKLMLSIKLEEKEILSRAYDFIPRDSNYLFQDGIKVQNYRPGNYNVTFLLYDSKGNKLAEVNTSFAITPLASIARPSVIRKSAGEKNYFLYYQAIGEQYYMVGDYSDALNYFRKAFELNSNYQPLLKRLIETMLMLNKINECIDLISSLQIEGDSELFYIIGKAYELYNDLSKAEQYYRESLQLYRDVRVLNALGKLYLKRGEGEKAMELFNESLQIKKDQEEIKTLIRKIE